MSDNTTPKHDPKVASVTVEFGSIGTIVAESATSKAGNTWFQALSPLLALPGDTPEIALAALPEVTVSGTTLKAGDVHTSQVTKRGGGNLTRSFSGSIELNGANYTVMVSVTYVKKAEPKPSGFRISVKVLPPSPGRQLKTVGEVSGFATV